MLYVAQGLPYGVYAEILPVYLRTQNVDLRQIGLLSLIGLAWTLKFLWAPIVEKWGRPQGWVTLMLIIFGVINGVIIFIPTHADFLPTLLFFMALMALSSATNDIAIDGYSIRYLNGRDIGKANGVRVAAYRIGLLLCGGILLLHRWFDWVVLFSVASSLLFILAAFTFFAPRLPEADTNPTTWISLWRTMRDDIHLQYQRAPGIFLSLSLTIIVFIVWMIDRVPKANPYIDLHAYLQTWGWSTDIPPWPWIWSIVAFMFLFMLRSKTKLSSETPAQEGGLMALLLRPHMPMVFAFILLFKLADASMGFMIKPFWVDNGFSPDQIGLVSVNIGIALSIAGALIGGWYTDRVGIFKSLWVMGLWQIASNGVYALAAWMLPTLSPTELEFSRPALIYTASAFESFTGGLGTASFLALLMALVNPRFATTEYATLSAVFAASRSIAGFLSGFGAYHMGYAPYFALTMFLGLPAFALLPWVKKALNSIPERSNA